MVPLHLSIIIPAYNEAQRIGATLRAIHHFLAPKAYTWEIIVVDDGSTDLTAQIVHNAAARIPHLSLTQLPTNLGKGAAVRAGMLRARGTARLFADADNSTSIEQVDKLMPFLREGVDVVIGSRTAPGASITRRQSPAREVLGATFRFLAHIILPLPVTDTQNGFKLFSGPAADVLFTELRTNGWSFDVEVLATALKHGFAIKEVPIHWSNDNRSHMQFRHMLRMPLELIHMYMRLNATTEKPRAASAAYDAL